MEDPRCQLDGMSGKDKLKEAGRLWRELAAAEKKVFQEQAAQGKDDVRARLEELEKQDAMKKSVAFDWGDKRFLSKVRFQCVDGRDRMPDQQVTVWEQKGADVVVPRQMQPVFSH